MSTRTYMFLFCASLALTAAACGNDKEDTVLGPGGDGGRGNAVPSEMVGVWEMTLTIRDCGAKNGFTITDTTTVCPDDAVEGDTSPEHCDVTVSGNEFRAVCEETSDDYGCRFVSTTTSNASVTENEFTFYGRVETSYSEACGGTQYCAEVVGSGRKIGPAPNPCSSGNEIGNPSGRSMTVSGTDGAMAIGTDRVDRAFRAMRNALVTIGS